MNFSSKINDLRFFTIGRFISTVLTGIFYLLFAILLEPDLYGEMTFWMSLAGTVSVIARFGLPHSVTVYQSKKKISLALQTNQLAAILAGIAAILLIPINIYSALLSLAMTFFLMNQFNLVGLKQYKYFLKNSIINGVLLVVLPLILYFILDIPGILIGIAIANLVSSPFFIKFIKIKNQSFSELKSDNKFLFHNFAVDAAPNLVRFLDKLIIAPLYGFALTGLYQFNLQILLLLEILPLSLHAFLLSEESSGKNHSKLYVFVILFSILLSLLIFFISPFVISKFFPNYSEGIFSLQIIVFSVIPTSFSSVITAKLQSKESTTVGYASLVRISLLIILIFYLGANYNLLGLSYAILVSSIVYSMVLGIIYYKTIKS